MRRVGMGGGCVLERGGWIGEGCGGEAYGWKRMLVEACLRVR